jgi:hypothetical protein
MSMVHWRTTPILVNLGIDLVVNGLEDLVHAIVKLVGFSIALLLDVVQDGCHDVHPFFAFQGDLVFVHVSLAGGEGAVSSGPR